MLAVLVCSLAGTSIIDTSQEKPSLMAALARGLVRSQHLRGESKKATCALDGLDVRFHLRAEVTIAISVISYVTAYLPRQ